MLGKQRHFYGFFMGFDLPRFCYRYVDDQAETRYTPSLYNNISVSFRAYLALAGCWENRDIFTGFLRVFTPPFLDLLQRKRDIPPSLYNNISVSFRAYLALAGCWENRDIFTGFLRVFTPPFFDIFTLTTLRKRDIPLSLYNNISVSFRAYLALAGCWENRDIFTGFLRVFTPPFF